MLMLRLLHLCAAASGPNHLEQGRGKPLLISCQSETLPRFSLPQTLSQVRRPPVTSGCQNWSRGRPFPCIQPLSTGVTGAPPPPLKHALAPPLSEHERLENAGIIRCPQN